MKERVIYQIKDKGVLKTKTKEFSSISQACNFVRSVSRTGEVFGKPTIETIYLQEK